MKLKYSKILSISFIALSVLALTSINGLANKENLITKNEIEKKEYIEIDDSENFLKYLDKDYQDGKQYDVKVIHSGPYNEWPKELREEFPNNDYTSDEVGNIYDLVEIK